MIHFELEYTHVDNVKLDIWSHVMKFDTKQQAVDFKAEIEKACEPWARYRIVEVTKKIVG